MIFYRDGGYRSINAEPGHIIAYYWFMAALLFSGASFSLAEDKYSTSRGLKPNISIPRQGVVVRMLADPDQNRVFLEIPGPPILSANPQKSRRAGPIRRRNLIGPGSSPAHCLSKCGNCTPCTPVRIRIQPEAMSTNEYYPEAWRCKCRKNIYMP